MVTISHPVSGETLNRGGSFTLPGLGLLFHSITRLQHQQYLLWWKFHHAYAIPCMDPLSP